MIMIMIIILTALVIFNIPYISRFLGKIYPFNWEYLYEAIINLKKYKKRSKKKLYTKHKLYTQKKVNLLVYSFVLSVTLSIVTYYVLSYILLNINKYNLLISISFLIILLLLMIMSEIDKRYYIIPDIFSYPFILFSVLFNSLIFDANKFNNVNLSLLFAESNIDMGIGGIYGYFSSAIISIIFHKKYKNAFGNGDIKMLAAIGVLIGINKLYKLILISFVLFFISSLFFKKKYMPYATILFPSFLIYLILHIL